MRVWTFVSTDVPRSTDRDHGDVIHDHHRDRAAQRRNRAVADEGLDQRRVRDRPVPGVGAGDRPVVLDAKEHDPAGTVGHACHSVDELGVRESLAVGLELHTERLAGCRELSHKVCVQSQRLCDRRITLWAICNTAAWTPSHRSRGVSHRTGQVGRPGRLDVTAV
jgi:hypothetical protein